MKEKRTTEKDRSLTFEIAQASPPTDLVVITTKSDQISIATLGA